MSNQLHERAGAKGHSHPPLPQPAGLGQHWEKGEMAWQQSRQTQRSKNILFADSANTPSSLLKSRAEFFLVVSYSAVKSRGSAASQKEEEVLVSSISSPQDLLTHLGVFFFLMALYFFCFLH